MTRSAASGDTQLELDELVISDPDAKIADGKGHFRHDLGLRGESSREQ